MHRIPRNLPKSVSCAACKTCWRSMALWGGRRAACLPHICLTGTSWLWPRKRTNIIRMNRSPVGLHALDTCCRSLTFKSKWNRVWLNNWPGVNPQIDNPSFSYYMPASMLTQSASLTSWNSHVQGTKYLRKITNELNTVNKRGLPLYKPDGWVGLFAGDTHKICAY